MSAHTPGPWEINYRGSVGHIKAILEPEVRTPTVCRWDTAAESIGIHERYANARLIAAAPDLLAALKSVEWSGARQAQGYGSMGRESMGLLVPACPSCGGVHPVAGTGAFIPSALGHRPACRLVAAIAKADGRQ